MHWYEAHGKGRFEFKIKRYLEYHMLGSNFVVCLRNAGYEASLDRGARYRLLPDAEAAKHHQIRIVDESGEDYLYPEDCFSRINEITICCADIGSVVKGQFGWASLSTEADQEGSSGKDIQALAELISHRLAQGKKVALGFECPLWVPVADRPMELTRARGGEGNRAYSASAGAASLVTGLTEVAWILERIRQAVQGVEAFLDWGAFERVQSGLFVWEALVTGKGKTGSHESDAKAAVDAFYRALPDPTSHDALKPTSRTRSLIGAALLWAGWSDDLGLLSRPCVVIRSEQSLYAAPDAGALPRTPIAQGRRVRT